MKINDQEFSKRELPLTVKLAREIKTDNFKRVTFIESTFHQTSQLESHHFYKPVSRLLRKK
jgi:hypothetical protein